MNPIPAFGLFGLALTLMAGASAEELGRLFFTPEQRAQLELGQRQSDSSPVETRALTVNGIVQKQGGGRTVWINGVPQSVGKSDERAPESLPLTIPGQSRTIHIKVGQKTVIGPAASNR